MNEVLIIAGMAIATFTIRYIMFGASRHIPAVALAAERAALCPACGADGDCRPRSVAE